jgi:hypothetical protein
VVLKCLVRRCFRLVIFHVGQPPIVQSEIHHKTAPAVDGVIIARGWKISHGGIFAGKIHTSYALEIFGTSKIPSFSQKYPAPMARPRL